MDTLSIPDLEQTVDVLRAVGGALRMRDDNPHLTVAENLAAAGGFLCGALQGKATDKDIDRMANNVQTFTQGLRAGLEARAEGGMVPWSEVKEELGIKNGSFRSDQGSALEEVAARSDVEVDDQGWPKSIWEGDSSEERLAKLTEIVQTALDEGADPYVRVGRVLLWHTLAPTLSDDEWKAKYPDMRQHAKEFCYGADYGGEITKLVGEPLTEEAAGGSPVSGSTTIVGEEGEGKTKLVDAAALVREGPGNPPAEPDNTDAEKKSKKKAKPRRRLHRATRS